MIDCYTELVYSSDRNMNQHAHFSLAMVVNRIYFVRTHAIIIALYMLEDWDMVCPTSITLHARKQFTTLYLHKEVAAMYRGVMSTKERRSSLQNVLINTSHLITCDSTTVSDI